MSISLTIEPKVAFSYPSARDFTLILKSVAELVDETAIQVDINGVHLKALDPSRIALLVVDLPPEAFQEFNVSQSTSIGLAVSNLVKILKNLKKSDRIVIAANEEYVEILVEGTTGGRRYKFRNINVLAEEVPEINPEYDIEASILAAALKNSLKELTDTAATIGITATGDTITFFDYDNKRSAVKLTAASGNIVNLIVRNSVTAAYDAEYLAKVSEILSLGHIVDLKYGAQAPLHLSLEFSGGKASYYLASKI